MTMETVAAGLCYDWALDYVRAHDDVLMVHGTIAEPFEVPEHRFPHAWIVENGIIRDWQCMVAGLGGRYSGTGYPEADFEETFKPRSATAFTAREATMLMTRSGHHGPWPKALIKQAKSFVRSHPWRR